MVDRVLEKTSLRSDRYSLDQFINQLKTFDSIALANGMESNNRSNFIGNFYFDIPAFVKYDYHRWKELKLSRMRPYGIGTSMCSNSHFYS